MDAGRWEKNAKCQTSTAHTSISIRRAWREVCRLIARGSSPGKLRARSYEAHGIEQFLGLK